MTRNEYMTVAATIAGALGASLTRPNKPFTSEQAFLIAKNAALITVALLTALGSESFGDK